MLTSNTLRSRFYPFRISAIKTGRYTYEKKFRDTKEVFELRNKDLSNTSETESNSGDDEVDAFIERLIEIQEKLIPDFRQSFDPSTLLEKQKEIYVSDENVCIVVGIPLLLA